MVTDESVSDDLVVLAMLPGNRLSIPREEVAFDEAVVAKSTPNAVPALHHEVAHERVSAKGGLDSVGGGVRPIVHIEQIVVASALAAVHGALPSPKKEAVSAMGYRVIGKDIAV